MENKRGKEEHWERYFGFECEEIGGYSNTHREDCCFLKVIWNIVLENCILINRAMKKCNYCNKNHGKVVFLKNIFSYLQEKYLTVKNYAS